MSNLPQQKEFCANCNRYHAINQEEKPIRISNRFDAYLKKINMQKSIVNSRQSDKIYTQLNEKHFTGCCKKSQNINYQPNIVRDSNQNLINNSNIKNDTKQISIETQQKKIGCWPKQQIPNSKFKQNENLNDNVNKNKFMYSGIQLQSVVAPKQKQSYLNGINSSYKNIDYGHKSNQFQVNNEFQKSPTLKKYDINENVQQAKSMQSLKSLEFIESNKQINKQQNQIVLNNKQKTQFKKKKSDIALLYSDSKTNQKFKNKRSSNKYQLIKDTKKKSKNQIKFMNPSQSGKSEKYFRPITLNDQDIYRQYGHKNYGNQILNTEYNISEKQVYEIDKSKKSVKKIERTYVDQNLIKFYQIKGKSQNISKKYFA